MSIFWMKLWDIMRPFPGYIVRRMVKWSLDAMATNQYKSIKQALVAATNEATLCCVRHVVSTLDEQIPLVIRRLAQNCQLVTIKICNAPVSDRYHHKSGLNVTNYETMPAPSGTWVETPGGRRLSLCSWWATLLKFFPTSAWNWKSGWHVLAPTKGHLEIRFSDMIVNLFLSSWISVCGGWSKFFRLQTAILREYKSYFCESLRIVYQYFLILISCICFSDATRFCEMKMRVTCKLLLI